MKRIAVLSVVLLFLVSSHASWAAENPAPEDQLTINPITPVAPDEEVDPLEAIGGYLWNRVQDFGDIFTIKLGWGTDKSLGFQARLIRPIQIGAGIFEGYQVALDRGMVGVMKEAEIEGGISILYPSYIARKVIWQSEAAKQANAFFGDVGPNAEITPESMKMYDDENQGWFVTTAQVELPYLPKVELSLNWGELFDFPLSFLGIHGFRVPPPFYKHPGPGDNPEMIPAPSIFWHGQEQYEKF